MHFKNTHYLFEYDLSYNFEKEVARKKSTGQMKKYDLYLKMRGSGKLFIVKFSKYAYLIKEYTMNKYFKYFLMFAVVALAFTATCGEANVFSTITARLMETFKSVRTVIFVVGGFGLIGLGFAAIFGKIKWPWLAALACGLAIVALAGAMVEYVTQQDGGTDQGYTTDDFTGGLGDTLTGSGG